MKIVVHAPTTVGLAAARQARLNAFFCGVALFEQVARQFSGLAGAKGTPADAPAEDDADADALVKHTHAKVGGGTETHEHDDAEPGHKHEDLLPMVVGKKALLASIKASDPDGDAGQLAQAIDASLDEAMSWVIE